MKVVNLKTFRGLPEGTIFCKGKPWYFENLSIKGETLSHDFVYLDPSWAEGEDSGDALSKMEISLENGSSFEGQRSYGRDGSFDNDAIFLIYEDVDLHRLKSAIETALKSN